MEEKEISQIFRLADLYKINKVCGIDVTYQNIVNMDRDRIVGLLTILKGLVNLESTLRMKKTLKRAGKKLLSNKKSYLKYLK